MSTFGAHRGLLGAAATLFVVSAVTTVLWCGSMSRMPGMEMPGGWTMSMAWMRMPGQSWFGAAATFVRMWAVMMMAMMLPVLVPMLVRYRAAVDDSGARLAHLTVLVAAGYFFVWTIAGVAAYPLGLALATAVMRFPALARAVPFAAGAIIVTAGLLQFTAWKSRQLTCCRTAPLHPLAADGRTAWEHGLRLGARCVNCCVGLTTVLLVVGVMDIRAMVVITLAIAVERIAPTRARAAQGTGSLMIAGGVWLTAVAVSG